MSVNGADSPWPGRHAPVDGCDALEGGDASMRLWMAVIMRQVVDVG
jgi:hypothetical protein